MNEVSGVIFSAGRKFSRPVLFGLDPPQKSLSRFNEERHDDANDRLSTAALISFSLLQVRRLYESGAYLNYG